MFSSQKIAFYYRMLLCLVFGFSSGLPLLVTLDMLKAWMKDQQIELAVIGVTSIVGLPYSLKFLWAPFLDRIVPPFLGRRRGWMLITQVGLLAAICLMGYCQPREHPNYLFYCAILVCFLSASQDIVLDAYRRDFLPEIELGLGSSIFVAGYRIGMLCSGAVALSLADHLPWTQVYAFVACLMLVGILATIFSPEPETGEAAPRSMREAVINPLVDFFSKPEALSILGFILFYKLGDTIASSMTIPFYLELGFSKSEIAAVAKTFGLGALIGGGLLGGALILRIGLLRSLWLFGCLQAIGVLGFASLNYFGHDVRALAAVIGFENASIGLATSAFVGFMGTLCNRKFSATQYALFSSLAGLPRSLLSSRAGYMVEYLGWTNFFVVCAFLAIPGMLLLLKIGRWVPKD